MNDTISKGKIVTFLGSPRKIGYSTQLAREVARGARDAGFDVVEYDLCGEGARGCIGCFGCRERNECLQEDALRPMYKDLHGAAGVVVASPIYFYQVTGQTKQWIDRLLPLIDFLPSGAKSNCPGKKTVTIFSQGDPDKEAYKEGMLFLHGVLENACGWKVAESLICAGDPDTDSREFKGLMEQAYRTGLAFAE